jgi:protein AroM
VRIRKLGLLALGQTPRDDVTPTLLAFMGEGAAIVERGGLDGLSGEGIAEIQATGGEAAIETRLRDGRPVALAKARLMPRLAAAADRLHEECELVLLLCSGEFPELARAFPRLLEPIRIIRGVVGAAARGRRLGVVGPESDMDAAPSQWRPYAPDVVCSAASPYGRAESVAEGIAAAARDLAARGARVILLDDMGFTETHRAIAENASGVATMCATTLTAAALREAL